MHTQETLLRALYALEMAWHPAFDIRTANCRMDFRLPENRALFITLFRHVQVCRHFDHPELRGL